MRRGEVYLSELRHQGVGGVRDDGTDHTSEVTRGEGDTKLSRFGVGVLGVGEDVCVEDGHNLFKEVELGHSVGDLTRPEGNNGAKGEAGRLLLSYHLADSREEGGGELALGGCLNLYLDHLKGAEGDVSEHLSRGRSSTPHQSLVLLAVLLSKGVAVYVLEDLVEPILERSLKGISN